MASSQRLKAKLPKVLILGDEITHSYAELLVQYLSDVAVVSITAEESVDSNAIIDNFNEWVLSASPDVVYANTGMHDIKRPRDSQRMDRICDMHIRLTDYEANISQFIHIAKRLTDADVCIATTTPIIEDFHLNLFDHAYKRFNDDVVAINSIAQRVCKSSGVFLNDLYAAMTAGDGEADLITADGFTLSREGRIVAAKAAESVIRSVLQTRYAATRA